MKLARAISLILFCVFAAATTSGAQDAKQALNDQLFEAARKGDAVAVKALLDKGADVNAKFRYGATALSYAADKGHVEVVRLLLERGADVNVKDTFYHSSPIQWAAFKGHAPIVQALLEKGAEGVDDVLGIGADGGNIELVRIALADGKAKPETLSAALAAAEKGKHAEIVEMLKKAGAQPPPKADFEVDAETLKSYEGAYKSERGSELTVAVRDGKLTVNPSGQSFVLGAFDKTRFRPLEFEGVTLTFNVENGKAVSFTFKQGGTETIFKKVEKVEPPKQP
ncbi:MAG TPA: ankyrin repeat domain-containing protein [Pyrinomonadaceae bacterium]|jgi:ankyrin repeat protein|nr:ankyrin repeat domain-containing protein [Pyrinomonadaceae bacterium]